ncbi:MAG: molybdate ABC transporter substrate-binding protein [Smithellaceae bacterium]
MRTIYSITLLFVLLSFTSPFSVMAEGKISVAVAANFISAFKEMAADFEEKSGVKVDAIFSSTGNLYTQIHNGAPYDLFLSADVERPDLLQKEGLTDGTFIYARGQIILWSADKHFCSAPTWQEVLKNDKIKKIAIANPTTAPYGASAKAALTKAGLWDALQSKLVMAQTIAQVFQYASTQAVDTGFCALSAVSSELGEKGCFYVLPEASDIVQAGCILKRTKNTVSAELFMAYLLCDSAREIRKKHGYR